MNFSRWFCTFFLICTAIFMVSCSKLKYESIDGFTQGTTFHIVYSQPKKGVDMSSVIDSIFNHVDTTLSVYNKSSMISRINRGEDSIINQLFKDVFNRSYEIYKLSAGFFDVSAGPIFDLWGFGAKDRESVTREKLDSLFKLVGMDKFRIVGDTIYKDNWNGVLNFNAIAKGYTSDLVGYELERLGVENYLVEIGGEIRTKGLNPKGTLWKIGIDKPMDGNLIQGANIQQVIYMSNGALATSGNYRKFYEVEGVKYSHTIDPISGYPVKHSLLSATVFAPDVMTADAFATWFMVIGLEKAIEIVESMPEIEAFLIYSQGEEFAVYSSKGVNLGE